MIEKKQLLAFGLRATPIGRRFSMVKKKPQTAFRSCSHHLQGFALLNHWKGKIIGLVFIALPQTRYARYVQATILDLYLYNGIYRTFNAVSQ
ncbi:MAG: hypothetical protein P9L91_05910 [Candidatus Zophobacter franzmannii]|nr:hypothetical protein [Candidatus Zophobacter franzmannii]